MRRSIVLLLFLATACGHVGFHPREVNGYLSGGKSLSNFHGHSIFHTVQFELAGESALSKRWLRTPDAGVSVSYNDIRQARSWFGYRYGDPSDSVRAVSSYFFLRHFWRQSSNIEPYTELGTGPMWSNRRVPAATSRFNFNSQLGLGAVLFPRSRMPLHVGYRFSHISNGGAEGRNPGLEVHQIVIGTRLMRLR